MLKVADSGLSSTTTAGLEKYQNLVDQADNYKGQVETARLLFSRHNQPRNRIFKVVRDRLKQMCHGPVCCQYCENPGANQIEHIKPKNLYPEETFAWLNYLYVCGACNIAKGNKYAVTTRNGNFTEVTRKRGNPVAPPVRGKPAFLEPRSLDPLKYMILDLPESFFFFADGGLNQF